LSRRVRQEVEDHLRGAVAADPRGDGLEAGPGSSASAGWSDSCQTDSTTP
jgi:hypothetical protein